MQSDQLCSIGADMMSATSLSLSIHNFITLCSHLSYHTRVQETTTSSDLSPCSEGGGGQTGSRGAGLEPLGEEAGQEDSDRDSEAGASSLDSLDEGLGDINCENEVKKYHW